MPNDCTDEMAIRALAHAYADAVNRRDAEGMAAVLAPDGVIEKPGYGEPVCGHEKILKRYRRLQRDREFLCQMIHSGVVHVDGDQATARWWFSEIKKPTGSEDFQTMIGVYQDEARRLAKGWRFTRRVQTTLLDRKLPAGSEVTTHPLPGFFDISDLPQL